MTVGIDKEGWRGRKRVKKSKKKNRLTSSPSASPARLSNQFNSNFFINLFFVKNERIKPFCLLLSFIVFVSPVGTCQMLALLFARSWISKLDQQLIHIHKTLLFCFESCVLEFHIFQFNPKFDISWIYWLTWLLHLRASHFAQSRNKHPPLTSL